MESDERILSVEHKARRLYAETVWTHKILEKRADSLRRGSSILQVIALMCVAATTVGLSAAVFGKSGSATVVAALISMVALACELLSCSRDYPSRIQEAAWSAKGFLELRETLLNLLTDLKFGTIGGDDAEKRIMECSVRYIELCRNAPSTDDHAVREASESLKKKQDSTYSENEIDELLPECLRRS